MRKFECETLFAMALAPITANLPYVESEFGKLIVSAIDDPTSVKSVFHQSRIDASNEDGHVLNEKLQSTKLAAGTGEVKLVDHIFLTEYHISLTELLEYPVIGTYVDERITPGFYYRVRRIATNNFLWNGAARCLLSVGMGYGKRITFRSDDLLNTSDYYMYSDTESEGFAFSPAVPIPDNKEFTIHDSNKRLVASIKLNSIFPDSIVTLAPPTLLSPDNTADMEARFLCRFTCDKQMASCPGGVLSLEPSLTGCVLEGVAHVVRKGAKSQARLTHFSHVKNLAHSNSASGFNCGAVTLHTSS